jgi:hypothetical protein
VYVPLVKVAVRTVVPSLARILRFIVGEPDTSRVNEFLFQFVESLVKTMLIGMLA